MKRLMLAIPVLLVTLLAAALIAPNFIDWSKYKSQAQTQIKKITGLDVLMNGDLGLAVFPAPHLYAEEVVVKAPQGSSRENLAALDRLDVSVALMPLISGSVKVTSVHLVKPEIAIEVLPSGAQNWETPEIKALRNREKPEIQGGPNSFADSVSLENVSIEDGVLDYINTPAKQTTSLRDVDLEIEAQTLQGPFDVQGSVVLSGQKIGFDITTGKMEQGAKSMSVKALVDMKERGLDIDYAGVVSFGEKVEVQGETAINASPLSKTAPGLKLDPDSASVKGILTASPERFEYKNLTLVAGGQKLSGTLNGMVSPLFVKGDLKAADTFNADKFLPASAGGSKGFDPSRPGAFLPQKISVPANMGGDIKLSLPGVIYKKQIYSNVDLNLVKKDNVFEVVFDAAQIPGKGSASGSAQLKFTGSKPAPEGGNTIYTGPVLYTSLKAKTQNAAQSLEAITGQPAPPALLKAMQLDGSASIEPARLNVSKATVVMDGTTYTGSGELKDKLVDATVSAKGGSLSVKGALEGSSLNNVSIKATHQNLATALQEFTAAKKRNPLFEKPVSFAARLNTKGKVYELNNIQASLGSDTMTGDAVYNAGGAKPDLKATLRFENLNLQTAKATAKGAGSGAGQGTQRWSRDPIDTGWLNAANAELDIAAKSIKYDTWDLSSPSIKVNLKDGILDVKQLEAGLYEGKIAMSGMLNGTSGTPSLTADAKIDNVQFEHLIGSFVGNRIIKGSGKVSMDVDISTAGNSQWAMVSALKGQGTTNGSNMILEGFDLTRFARALSEEAKPGDTLLGLWKGTIKGGSTQFDTMNGEFNIQQGVVNISRLDLDGPKALLTTTGNVNLPQWTIATAHNITLKERKDVPPFTINISGPLDNPGQTFAQGVLKDYLSRKVNRKLEKILTDKLGLPSGQAPAAGDETAPPADGLAPAPQQQQQPGTPEEALRGILEGLIQQ